MSARLAPVFLALALGISGAPAAAQSTVASGDGVNLRGLDKISGLTTDLALSVGETISYGRMSISLISCRYPADDPSAEAYAFLEIIHETRNERMFYGWMVASSPALNALDDARYDVWVLSCQ